MYKTLTTALILANLLTVGCAPATNAPSVEQAAAKATEQAVLHPEDAETLVHALQASCTEDQDAVIALIGTPDDVYTELTDTTIEVTYWHWDFNYATSFEVNSDDLETCHISTFDLEG